MTEPTDELSRLDREIPVLRAAADRARQLWVEADTALQAAQRRRDELAWTRLAPLHTPAPPPATAAPRAVATGPETSTRTVQNLLFVLGGLLLGIAAIVFTAVAWSTFGLTGRAMILATVTVLMLAVPLLALHRHLRATAETFAAIGLLLVALDGWAAWSVGFIDLPLARYAGVVAAVTATIALGYRLLTRLTGPTFAALAAAQPVLPLLLLDTHPAPRVWVLIALAVAVMNLAVAAMRTPVRELAFGAFGAATLAATVTALSLPVSLAATGLVVLCAAVVLAGAVVSRVGGLLTVAAGWQMASVLIGGSRYLAEAQADHALVLIAALVAAVVCLAVVVGRYLPAVRPGLVVASYAGAGTLALALILPAVMAASAPVVRAVPMWSAGLEWAPVSDWQLLLALLLAAVAVGAVLPAEARPALVVGAVVGIAVTAPGAVALVWWAAPALDLVAAALLIAVASTVYGRSRSLAPPLAIGAGVLATHGLLASLVRPELTAATLTALGVLGLVAAARTTPPLRAAGIATAFAAVPPAIGAWLVAGDVAEAWVQRLTVTAAIVTIPALVPLRRTGLRPWAHGAASAGAAVWPLVVVAQGAEPAGVYGAIGLLGVALAFAHNRDRGAWVVAVIAGATPAVVVAGVEAQPVAGVVGLPFQWLGAIWSGVSGGTGLVPAGSRGPTVAWSDVVALAVVGLASAVAAYARTSRVASAIAGLAVGTPTALLLAVAVARAPWPVLPAAALLLGLAGLVASAVARVGPERTAVIAGQGLAYAGAGMAPLLALRWSTLVGLGLVVVAGAVIGTAGRSAAWRIAGHLGAVAAAVSAASAAALAADLALRTSAYPVLAVAAVALTYGASRHGRRDARALEAAAHAAAVVALVYTIGWPNHAASVCALWGLVIGARALWPATSPAGRAALAAAAGACELFGWWLLLAAREVSLTEAYTLPLAAVALLAGVAAVRSRPDLRSWVAYGPALAAGFLPTLATVLVGPGEPWRRLALGTGALAVIIIGATRRLRAPVLTGGGVLVVVAIHELALVWQLLPSWSPLAVGGAILVGLAITYERRRRDLARLRTALTRMH